jgi:glyoxylase I family protein
MSKLLSGFHHVAIKASNFDASVRFYTALGMKEKISWGEGEKRAIMLDAGAGDYIEIFAGGNADQPQAGWFHIALRTDDVDAITAVALKAGATIFVEPKDVTLQSKPPTPVRLAFVKGPDGETIEFFQNELT